MNTFFIINSTLFIKRKWRLLEARAINMVSDAILTYQSTAETIL